MTYKNLDSSSNPHAVISFMADRLMDEKEVLVALQSLGVPLPLLPGVIAADGQAGQAMNSGLRIWLACGLADNGLVLLFAGPGLAVQEPDSLECLLAAACLPYLVYRS
ncbi:MAG: hypothetical protein KKI09_08230 [Spirochaetes bacterium]|nr:hypothetical protein [Spirochaetota bacterium]